MCVTVYMRKREKRARKALFKSSLKQVHKDFLMYKNMAECKEDVYIFLYGPRLQCCILPF